MEATQPRFTHSRALPHRFTVRVTIPNMTGAAPRTMTLYAAREYKCDNGARYYEVLRDTGRGCFNVPVSLCRTVHPGFAPILPRLATRAERKGRAHRHYGGLWRASA